jgi:hypothetical protein
VYDELAPEARAIALRLALQPSRILGLMLDLQEPAEGCDLQAAD